MKIEVLDAAATRLLQRAFLQALEKVAVEFGVSVTQAGGSIGETEATLKFKVTANSSVASEARDKLIRRDLELLGLSPDALGRTFKSRGTEYRVVSVHLERPKFPITAARVPDGKLFKFTRESVKVIGLVAP